MRLSIFVRRSVISLLGVLALSLGVAYAQTPNVCVSKSANNERSKQGLGSAYSQTQNGVAYPIDLQTTLRLAGAQNLDIRIARSELQKARANQLMAWEKFLPWLSPGAVFERRYGLSFSSGNGAINEADYGYNLPGLLSWDVCLSGMRSLTPFPQDNSSGPQVTLSTLNGKTPRWRPP